jgi:hypothetical protein
MRAERIGNVIEVMSRTGAGWKAVLLADLQPAVAEVSLLV